MSARHPPSEPDQRTARASGSDAMPCFSRLYRGQSRWGDRRVGVRAARTALDVAEAAQPPVVGRLRDVFGDRNQDLDDPMPGIAVEPTCWTAVANSRRTRRIAVLPGDGGDGRSRTRTWDLFLISQARVRAACIRQHASAHENACIWRPAWDRLRQLADAGVGRSRDAGVRAVCAVGAMFAREWWPTQAAGVGPRR